MAPVSSISCNMTYYAPTRDLYFAVTELADLEGVRALPGHEEATDDLFSTVLEAAGRFAGEVLAPINRNGDVQGAKLEQGRVMTPDGWKEAYHQFIEDGWNGLPFDPEYGGQGLPRVISVAVQEIWYAANMAFGLCPLLTQGAIDALMSHATAEQKDQYLGKLVSGEWTGTMNLTEPQAGSDLSGVKTKAVAHEDHYLITGQKIFITYGDHDLTDNIIHLVLARTPDAPQGIKGISLFLVPKFLPDEKGHYVVRNDIETISLEHKLGIHGSPTAMLGYGTQKGGAVGYLVGEINEGLRCMFTMMNVARHTVGIQGYALSERAYQQAVAFASERVQGRAVDDPAGSRVKIIEHPDVKRLLLLQKCRIETLRALSLVTASSMDKSERHPDPIQRQRYRALVEIMTPIVKGYATELGLENVSLALQVHGGMGFIEETGAAQHYRDQRITPIYEGTTGIQAIDLVGRKLVRDGGVMAAQVIEMIHQDSRLFSNEAPISSMVVSLETSIEQLQFSIQCILRMAKQDPKISAAVSDPYLRLWGVIACGWQAVKAADIAIRKRQSGSDDPFYQHKIEVAKFYFAVEMPKVDYYVRLIRDSGDIVARTDQSLFALSG